MIKKTLENNSKKYSRFHFEALSGRDSIIYYCSDNGTDYQIIYKEKIIFPQKNNKYNIVGMIGRSWGGDDNELATLIIHDIANGQCYKVDTNRDIQFFQGVNISGGAFIVE